MVVQEAPFTGVTSDNKTIPPPPKKKKKKHAHDQRISQHYFNM